MILKQGLALAFIGTAVGLLVSLGVTRFAASLLYGVSPTDPLTLVVVPSSLIAAEFWRVCACARGCPIGSCTSSAASNAPPLDAGPGHQRSPACGLADDGLADPRP